MKLMVIHSKKNSRPRYSRIHIRTSSHHLAIETRRWHKPISLPYNDRKCIVCDKLDDEYHFVIECTLLHDIIGRHHVCSNLLPL